MNFKQVLQLFVADLSILYGVEEAKAIFGIVAGHLSGLDRGQLTLKWTEEVNAAEFIAYTQVLQELTTGRPLQYVLGETVFYGLRLQVAPGVLIPRPETEELVDWVINTVGETAFADLSILDVGTGSGCIAVSLKHELPDAAVSALDVSREALEIATSNASINRLDINFIEADIRTSSGVGQFDVIVSNPPYITMDEQREMHKNVLAHEPHLALFVSNEDPLVFYNAIADFALTALHPGGYLFFEINEHLGQEMVELLLLKGFTDVDLRKDMQGKDRMIRCRRD
jgi:release factor glutamine methyltransferase